MKLNFLKWQQNGSNFFPGSTPGEVYSEKLVVSIYFNTDETKKNFEISNKNRHFELIGNGSISLSNII